MLLLVCLFSKFIPLASALLAKDCFVKSPEIAGSSTETSVTFSDEDILTRFYVPGMEVRSLVACYDYEV